MATLSANSRRNSSTSTVANSSRSSNSNGSAVTESVKPSMQPLNEEEIISEPIPLPPPSNAKMLTTDQTDNINETQLHTVIDQSSIMSNGSKERCEKLKTCTERSDSGFSDCSNISNGNATSNGTNATSNVTTTHPLFDKINSILEEKSNNEQNQRDSTANNLKEFNGMVSVNMLKMKLEKMAEAQQETKPFVQMHKKVVKKLSAPFVIETNEEEVKIEQKIDSQQIRTSYSFDFDDVDFTQDAEDQPKSLPIKPAQKSLMRSASLHQKRIVEKEPIMRSDFTNTVKMRKKSLETSALREKQPHTQRILLEQSGKVSKLLRRFDSQNANDDVSEPIIQTPDIDDSMKENDDINKVDASKHDNEIVEILNTPMAAVQPPPSPSSKTRKSPSKIAKPIVSSGSMKRTVASKLEYTNTKTCVTSMEVKVSSQRQSPTKFANAQTQPVNHVIPKAIQNQSKNANSLKKIPKSSPPVDGTTIGIQRASRITNATTNKTTAYASFNRTSPVRVSDVRLSGRVKDVTDRLSAPKAAIAMASSSLRDRTVLKHPAKCSNLKQSMANSVAHQHQHQHQIAMSGTTIEQHIVTVAEAVIETEHQVEHSINGKIDGTFTLKSKMNENFRKASAFWKAT